MRGRARGRKAPGKMNDTEAMYAAHLELRRRAGEVAWYAYEGMKFRLADRTFYTPDFNVMLSNFEMEMHEVKGFMEDDAAVKIKVVAEIYPFRFFLAHRVRKQWDIKEV